MLGVHSEYKGLKEGQAEGWKFSKDVERGWLGKWETNKKSVMSQNTRKKDVSRSG